MPEPLTIEKTFPVLGSYQLSTPMPSSDMSASTSTTATTSNTTSTSTDATVSTTTNSMSTDASGMTSTANVTITLDSANKGMIWVEGLPQGKFKAYLKQSPATYRVIAQKTESGTDIPEGTLYFDSSSKVLNVAIGKSYDEANPTAIFSMTTTDATAMDNTAAEANTGKTVKVKTKTPTSKKKEKVIFYTATKIEAAPAATGTQDSMQQQSTDSTQQNQTQPQSPNQQQ